MTAVRSRWNLGVLEDQVRRTDETSRPFRLMTWDAVYAAGLTFACLLGYEATTVLLTGFLDRGNVFLGGMWTVVATIFVFRHAGTGGRAAGAARFVATCVSILLCFLYLLALPFTAFGMACLVGLGVLLLAFAGQRDDIVTTGITTAVVTVVAGLSPRHAWQQPLLRLLDTVVGVAVGIACKSFVLVIFLGCIGNLPLSPVQVSPPGPEREAWPK